MTVSRGSRRSGRPSWALPSFRIDLRCLLSGVRPTVRTTATGARDQAEVFAWARRMGLHAVLDSAGFVTLSRSASRARRAMDVDWSPGHHTAALGLLLGYPACCARTAARVGDAGLDAWKTPERRRYVGRFAAIDVGGYGRGHGFLSHVPCSPRCVPSLRQAEAAAAWERRRMELRKTPARSGLQTVGRTLGGQLDAAACASFAVRTWMTRVLSRARWRAAVSGFGRCCGSCT